MCRKNHPQWIAGFQSYYLNFHLWHPFNLRLNLITNITSHHLKRTGPREICQGNWQQKLNILLWYLAARWTVVYTQSFVFN